MVAERNIWEQKVKDLFQEYNSGYASIDTIREEIETELIEDIPETDMASIMQEVQEMEDREVELMSLDDFENIEELDEMSLGFLNDEESW